ncbi:histidine phosphatase family protein [Bacillus cereus]|uniref:histidine phosphatase family protein n=1 Tax=Bacillus cereus TaxID=1396 RepID=UPI0011161A05|nr:histidine phosphatase family protein [Bacillus cereus]
MPNTKINFALFEQIQRGGYVLYLRHAKPLNNTLSDEGKEQAKKIGHIFKEHHIPIQYPVLTSPIARTIETGKLAFGDGDQHSEIYENLKFIDDLYKTGMNHPIKNDLIASFEKKPSENQNSVFVGHDHCFHESIQCQIDTNHCLCYLDTVILQPKGQGNGFEFVGLISLKQFITWNN